jgi:GTP cyclohydrolase I
MRVNPHMTNSLSSDMPDVSMMQKSEFSARLSQVGMGKIEMPILYACGFQQPVMLPALIDAYVSLDNPDAKGIHMSRLYLELKNGFREKPVTLVSLKEILLKFIESHKDLSESAYLELKFSVPMERKALVSGEVGFRQYPVTMRASLKGKRYDAILGTEVLYSSTCPCSTALARQLMQQAFIEQFNVGKDSKTTLEKAEVAAWLASPASMVAYPHAQRSLAHVEVRIKDGAKTPSLIELIDLAENALGTPVQAAVKRSDEQEFARLNAQNLMFCEDAARKLRGALEKDGRFSDYYIHVEHQESLHPHDAISRVVKGIPGGFTV